MENTLRRSDTLQTPPPSRRKGVILLAQTDRVSLTMLECRLEQSGYEVLASTDGRDVQEIIQARGAEIDVMMLEGELPSINGYMLCRLVRRDPRLQAIPLVMLMRGVTPEAARHALEAGFSYCLDKTEKTEMFEAILETIMRDGALRKHIIEDMQRMRRAMTFVDTARFHCRTLRDAEDLALFLANAFPEPERVAVGLGELLINAVEHGNLGIGYNEKTRLVRHGGWREEVERRADLSENIEKTAEVVLQRKPDAVFVQITDRGPGFNWSAYLSIDPSRAADGHGRGIAQAYAQSFDNMRYNPAGNQVTAVVYLKEEQANAIEW